MAAWKTLLWEGELAPGQTVLVLGATGTSGRIATQLAVRRGARVVAAGRNQRVLAQLVARGADAMIRVDRPREELAEAIAAEGPYDLIVDYLWGAPAEAAFAALLRQVVAGEIQPRHRRRAARQGRAGLATGRKRPARRLRALTAGGLDPGPRRPGAPGGDVIA